MTTATRLQGVGPRRLTNGQRLRTKVALREALAERRARAAGRSLGWRGWWGQARGLAVAAMLILCLFVTAGVTSVAASRPGDVAYPVRVTLERAPAWLQFSPAGRAAVELQVAERRLADVTGYLQATGQVAPAAVDALLAGDQAAAANAAALPERERDAITRRVAAHAETLAALAQTAGPGAAELALDEAAAQAAALAERLSPGPNATRRRRPQRADLAAADRRSGHRPPAPTPGAIRYALNRTPRRHANAAADAHRPRHRPRPTGHRPGADRDRGRADGQPDAGCHADAHRRNDSADARSRQPGEHARARPARNGSGCHRHAQPPTATPSPEPPPTERPSEATGTPAPGRRATALAQTATAQAALATPTPGHGHILLLSRSPTVSHQEAA